MKKLLVMGLLVLSVGSLAGCQKKKEEKQYTKKEQQAIKRGYGMPIEKAEKAKAKKDSIQAFKTKRTDFEVSSNTVGEVRTIKSSKRKELEVFIKNAKKGKKGSIVLYYRSDDLLVREKFTFDGKKMYYLYDNASKNAKGQVVVGAFTYSRIKSWKYTKKGWFLYEFCEPESTEEIDTRAMIRVKAWNKEYLTIAQAYINPIGYKGNNLFMMDWNEQSTKKLDLNGAYEYFYGMEYGKSLNHTQEESGIKEDDFESLMTEYLPVSVEQVRQQATMNENGDGYAWVELACGNYAPNAFGTSIPEVTKVEKKKDGTMVVTVDAVCEMLGNDTLMTHEVTLKVSKGQVKYLGNHVVKGKGKIPEYKERIS